MRRIDFAGVWKPHRADSRLDRVSGRREDVAKCAGGARRLLGGVDQRTKPLRRPHDPGIGEGNHVSLSRAHREISTHGDVRTGCVDDLGARHAGEGVAQDVGSLVGRATVDDDKLVRRSELRPKAVGEPQAAELDVLTGGRLRLGIGVGGSAEEYAAMRQDFNTRGARIEEQIELMRALWTNETVDFEGRWDTVRGSGLAPLPLQRPIPVWIGARGVPAPRIRTRIGRQADGWFVLCSPEEFPAVKGDIDRAARQAGRDSASIGMEAGCGRGGAA